tara:strand:- start:74 stop:535 length:462 start_codon:yes stop_codon:yes gene_type:complete
MVFRFKHKVFSLLIFLIFILNSCKLQEPTKNHGILYLENRSKKLILNTTNTNDVLRIIGEPHTKSINDKNEWIYIERILTKGRFIKLGQNILKENNVLILRFNKYGILEEKIFLDKNSKKNLKFSEKRTENSLSQKSSVEKFLESLRKKMYKK